MGIPALQTLGTQLVVTGATSVTPAMPAGIVAGDTLIAVAFNQATGTVYGSTPTGWTLGDSLTTGNVSGIWYWKDAVGGDTSPTITWTGAQTSNAEVLRFNGSSNAAAPIGHTSNAKANSSTLITVPGLVASGNSSLMVYLVCANGPSQTVGPGIDYTLLQHIARNSNGNTCWVDGSVSVSGVTSADCIMSIASADWVGFGFEILGSGAGAAASVRATGVDQQVLETYSDPKNIRATGVVQQVLETYSDPKHVRATGVVLQVLCNISGAQNPSFLNQDTWFTCSTDDILQVPRVLG